MKNNFTRLKYACYVTNISMAVVSNFSPLLFLTFRSLYGISYSLLGLLILINFCTQLAVDLIFSFFSHKFNISCAVKLTPVLTSVGLLVFTVSPWILPNDLVYIGLALGTLIFSASGGLTEVLISPIIAKIPAKDPDREMSKLHSIYAWGAVAIVVIATLYIYLFGAENWQWISLLFTLIPITACILYAGVEIPDIESGGKTEGTLKMLKNGGVWLCVLGIFLGGSAECTMSQWSSGYVEGALRIPKILGDIFGVALFSLALGFGRTLYSKIGKNIEKVLFFGAIGATACYLIATFSSIAFVGLVACAATGFCVSMLWPGMLIVASEKFPSSGVFIYALMASGGDLGASVGPQLVGLVTDAVIANNTAISLAEKLALTPEQLGMKAGMLAGTLFPLAAIFIFLALWKGKRKEVK